MSDGHFNRSLLPSGGNYAAGVRAGEARMRSRAQKALAEVLAAESSFSAEERGRIADAFQEALGH